MGSNTTASKKKKQSWLVGAGMVIIAIILLSVALVCKAGKKGKQESWKSMARELFLASGKRML